MEEEWMAYRTYFRFLDVLFNKICRAVRVVTLGNIDLKTNNSTD